MKKFLTATVMAAAMAAVSAPAQAQVRITGATTGCFYTTAFTCLSTGTYNGLTFTGGSFDIDLANPGSLHELNTLSDYLGKFTLASNTSFDFGGSLRFRLSVNFTSPTTASPTPAYFIAKFYGTTLVDGDDDQLDVNFDNDDIKVDYTGAGSSEFYFRVNDINNLERDDVDGQLLVGQIKCYEKDERKDAKYDTCTPAAQASSVVPEPSTYALMAAGLAALGIVARRRKASGE